MSRRSRAIRDEDAVSEEVSLEDDVGSPPPPQRPRMDVNKHQPCPPEGCRVNPQNQDDINCHRGPNGRILPCPLYYTDFCDVNLENLDPVKISQDVCNSWNDAHDVILLTLCAGVGDIRGQENTEVSRARIKSLFQCFGLFEVFRHMHADPGEMHAKEADTIQLTHFMSMLSTIVRPMRHVELAPGLRCVLTNAFYSLLYQTSNNFLTEISTLIGYIDAIITNSVKAGMITDDTVKQLKSDLNQCRNTMMAIDRSTNQIMEPPEIFIDLENGELNRDVMIDHIINYLASKGVVIADTESPSKALVALRRYEPNGEFNYTYTQPMPVGEALVQLKVDRPVSRIYAKQIENVSKELHTFHENSCIPRSPDDFVSRMRYIAYPNGIYCCITGIFYYHRHSFDNRMPQNWSHYSDILDRINNCKTRAMAYIKTPMRYYDMLCLMLGGVFLRSRLQSIRQKQRSSEQECIDQWHGNDTLYESIFEDNLELPPDLAEAQKAYIRDRLENFDAWVFNSAFLKEIDMLDIRCRAPQKIFGDQQLPRNAYRRWLSVQGRCLSGVIGRDTREKNGAQKYMERSIGRDIDDRLEFAAALIGTGGCGKSQLLAMIQRYFLQQYVGMLSDHERPIDNFSTIRDKGVCIASDYQTDKNKPSVPSGDFKKAVSNEPVVNHRLHQVSRIIYFFSMFVFASNNPLPFPEVNGDISRRIFQFYMKHKIPRESRKFSANDDRNVMQVFDQEDVDAYCIASTWEHRRILLNVGSTTVYEPPDLDFNVPQFLLNTQADFIRSQDSLTAFLLSLGKRFGWGHANYGHSVERERFIDMYKEYCDKFKVECKKDTAVDAELTRNYQVAINIGPPPMYMNIRVSFEAEDESVVLE